MTIESNRSLGIVAAIISVISSISGIIVIFTDSFPSTSIESLSLAAFLGLIGLLSFVGFILYLVAMHGLSKDYGERNIFGHIVTGLILTLLVALVGGVLLGVFFVFIFLTNSSTIQAANATAFFSIVSIIWVFFNVKALNLLSEKSGVSFFKTGAKILLIGALVNLAVNLGLALASNYISSPLNSIAAIPGSLLQMAAWILLAKAYYKITTPIATTPFSFPVSQQVRYCPKCGTQNTIQVLYCINCGQKQ